MLDDSRIVEVGRHDELLSNSDSLYSKLYALQLFDRQVIAKEQDNDQVIRPTKIRPAGGLER